MYSNTGEEMTKNQSIILDRLIPSDQLPLLPDGAIVHGDGAQLFRGRVRGNLPPTRVGNGAPRACRVQRPELGPILADNQRGRIKTVTDKRVEAFVILHHCRAAPINCKTCAAN